MHQYRFLNIYFNVLDIQFVKIYVFTWFKYEILYKDYYIIIFKNLI